MKVLAAYGLKGGVGKTSTCVALADLAARDGLRTLLFDLDPQGAASWIHRARVRSGGARRLARGAVDLSEHVLGTDHENLDLLPASEAYAKLDLALAEAGGHRERLAELLVPLAGEYDLVLLDTAPTLARVAQAVFGAADALVTPTIPTPLALRTLARLLVHLKREERRPPVLPFFSMVDRRKALHRRVCAFAEEERLGFLAAEVPYSAAVERMAVERRPLFAFAPGDRAARAYRVLWTEVRARLETPGDGAVAATRGRVEALLERARARGEEREPA